MFASILVGLYRAFAAVFRGVFRRVIDRVWVGAKKNCGGGLFDFRDSRLSVAARKSSLDHSFEHWDKRISADRALQIGETLFPPVRLRQTCRTFALWALRAHVAEPHDERSDRRDQIDDVHIGPVDVSAHIKP